LLARIAMRWIIRLARYMVISAIKNYPVIDKDSCKF
jgi:hypothetical protein